MRLSQCLQGSDRTQDTAGTQPISKQKAEK